MNVHELRAQEQAVGISVFVRPDAPAFECVIKQRYTDFLVNEVLPDGQTLHLVQDEHSADRKRKLESGSDNDEIHKKLKRDRDVNTQSSAPKGEDDVPPGSRHIKTEIDISAKPDVVDASESIPNSGDGKANVTAAKEAAIASISDEDKATLQNLFSIPTAASILDLYACTVVFPNKKPRDQPTIKSKHFAEKSQRTGAHMAIRRIFGANKLESTTVQEGQESIISVKATPPKKPVDPNASQKEQQKGKIAWSELGGEYLHFTLYKENKDTMEVLYFLASQLKLDIKHFSFAGTKDRRGVTVQRVAVRRIKRERMEGINRTARGFKMSGPWSYQPNGLDLGDLGGNEFILTLRNVRCASQDASLDAEGQLKHTAATVTSAARSLTQSGYINFYGMQRFGTHTVGTHTIGMKMLRGDLKGAVDGILHYDPSLINYYEASNGQAESTEQAESKGQAESNGHHDKSRIPEDDIRRATAIHAFRSGARTADVLANLPGTRFAAEKSIMTFLGKTVHKTGAKPNATDYQGALWHIARNLRLLYLHAYQGFIWNTVAGKRWEMCGDKVVEGDLVVVGEKEQQEGSLNDAKGQSEEVDEAGEPIIHPSASAAAGTNDNVSLNEMPAELGNDAFVRARPLSKAEAESGRYSVFDLVLPLPGFDVIYPNNAIGKFYEEIMSSELGGGLDPHNMRRSWREMSLSGGYRKMMSQPLSPGVEVLQVKAYGAADEQLVETDLEKIRKVGTKENVRNGDQKDANGDMQTGLKDKIAVVLKLKLGSSQYATMALRELTKGGAMGFQPQYSIAKR